MQRGRWAVDDECRRNIVEVVRRKVRRRRCRAGNTSPLCRLLWRQLFAKFYTWHLVFLPNLAYSTLEEMWVQCKTSGTVVKTQRFSQAGCPVTTSNAPHKHIRPIVRVHLKPHFHATRIVFMKSYLDFSHKLLSVPCCLVRCYALWKQIYYSIRRYVRIEQYTNDQCLLVYLIWMNMRNRTGNRSLKNAMALRGLLSEFEHHRSLNYWYYNAHLVNVNKVSRSRSHKISVQKRANR